MYIVFSSASPAVQRKQQRGEDADHRSARVDVDVAREERQTQEEEVELTAITLYLHLAGLELRGGRRASGAFPPLTHFHEAPVVMRHVHKALSRCFAVVREGKWGLAHCSRRGDDSEVGADAPRPPAARLKVVSTDLIFECPERRVEEYLPAVERRKSRGTVIAAQGYSAV